MTRGCSSSLLRPWRSGDEGGIDALLDPEVDPLWVNQSHSLHGPDDDATGFRRTVVATDADGRLLGAATISTSRIHPGRYPSAVEVHPDARRLGIGSTLFRALVALRPQPFAMSTKLRPSNTAAMSFVRMLGGRPYATCPCTTVDPRQHAVKVWCSRNGPRADAVVHDLSSIADADLLDALIRQYVWVHQLWSPVGDVGALREAFAEMLPSVDRAASSGATIGSGLRALSVAFVAASAAEVIAETMESTQPYGRSLLAACVARTIRVAAATGVSSIEFDGHESDPHQHPVTQSIPTQSTNPLHLIEVP